MAAEGSGSVEFQLSTAERFASGVQFDPSTRTLRLRGSGGIRAMNAGYGVVFLLFVVFGVTLLAMGQPMGLLAVVGGAAFAVPHLRFLRTRVEATTEGVEHVARWSRTFVPWGQIADVTTRHTGTTRRRRMVGGVPRDGTDLVIGDRFDHDAPVLVRVAGRPVVLTVLASLSRSDGFTLGEPSPAEMKADLLRRYWMSLGHAPTAADGSSPPRPHDER